jgi:hypothetical protein
VLVSNKVFSPLYRALFVSMKKYYITLFLNSTK